MRNKKNIKLLLFICITFFILYKPIKNEPKIRFIFIIYFINSKVFSVAFNLYLHPKGSVIIGVQ